MYIRLFFVYLSISISQILASCPYIRTSVILAECVFDTSLYFSLGTHIFNSNSIDFTGHYSFNNNNNNNNNTKNLVNNTLIYNLGNRWMLLVPLLLKCSHQSINLTFTECQYTLRQHKYKSRPASLTEYMTTQLSVVNVTDLGMQSVLFLEPGEITLRSCKAYDCSKELVYLTASNETFNFKINYEKPIGTKCQSDDDCRNTYSVTDLIHCDQITQTCQCSDENITTIDISGIGRLCTDSIDRSNCTKYPQRCLHWCDKSETSQCICPKSTRKVRKVNGIFDCELEPTGICRFDDEQTIGLNIRKCPTGTFCDGYRCRPLTIYRQLYEEISDESLSSSATTSIQNLYSSTSKQQNTSFIRTLIIIILAIILFFILILFIITMLIKSHRFHISSSSEDKVSSSSFAQSTITAMSTDFPNEVYQFKQDPIKSVDYSKRYDNYLTARPTFIHGLVPQANLPPRFHQALDERRRRRRAPLHIRSPSLTCISPFIDHALLTATNNNNAQRTHLPRVTRLQNGDVIISA